MVRVWSGASGGGCAGRGAQSNSPITVSLKAFILLCRALELIAPVELGPGTPQHPERRAESRRTSRCFPPFTASPPSTLSAGTLNIQDCSCLAVVVVRRLGAAFCSPPRATYKPVKCRGCMILIARPRQPLEPLRWSHMRQELAGVSRGVSRYSRNAGAEPVSHSLKDARRKVGFIETIIKC